jgi:hypothetical protein
MRMQACFKLLVELCTELGACEFTIDMLMERQRWAVSTVFNDQHGAEDM